MDLRAILVVGATGKQGSATIEALVESSHRRILALTRSASSLKSQALLKSHENITLVEGDIRNPAPIFVAHPDISAIFLVTVPPDEEAQAFPVIDFICTSNTCKIDHIVFSSVDRGGNEKSWNNSTIVPHFAAKHRIEIRLRDACAATAVGKNVRWTILRPTGFMDNYNPGRFGAMMSSLWRSGMSNDRRMQLISTHDIGLFAARALLHPEAWAGRAVGLAGCEMSYVEVQEVFRRVTGKDLPASPWIVAKGVLWFVDEAKKSFEWFSSEGWGADIGAVRGEEPRLQDFETWVRESSDWDCPAT